MWFVYDHSHLAEAIRSLEIIVNGEIKMLRKKVTVGLLSGLAGGLFLGIGGRLIMRILALEAQQMPAFSLEGSLGILFIGLIIGIISGLLYALLLSYLPDFIGKGPIFGLLVLAILVPLMPAPIQEEIAASAAGGRLWLATVLFRVLFAIFGFLLQVLFERINRSGAPAVIH
jgi:hypothetical protein